ncbi:tape measure protein [Paenibacillus solisilvae]|uniref:Tape measure protein n=1 Tax=Paenibacillus solisilvae TaxID=2486751 RepID=A0ABW0VYE3_9BACL
MAFNLEAIISVVDRSSAKLGRIARSMDITGRSVSALGGTVSMLNAGLAAVGGTYAAVVKPLQLASDAEQASIAFETMLGSATKAQKFLTELTDYANSTPFELPELRDSSKRLLAFGFAADKILPILTGVGNAAAGLGLGGEGVDRITMALGQMRAKSKVSGEEMMQLTEAGIPAWEILAKKMNVSTAEVMKMSEKGLIPANAAINALIEGMNEKFPDMMQKQSKSLAGLYSTMKDTFNSKILTKWGQGLATALKPRFDRLVTWIDNNKATIDQWGASLKYAANEGMDAVIRKFESGFSYIKTHFLDNPAFQKLKTFESKINFIFNDVMKTFNTWWAAEGKSKLESIASVATKTLVDAISTKSDDFAAAGLKIGAAIGSGMWTGISDSKAGKLMRKISPDWAENLMSGNTNIGDAAVDYLVPDWTPFIGDAGKPKNKHAGGLSSVPYNGYAAELHKGERVLTKAEADGYSGRSSNGVTVNVYGGMQVRQESDIAAVAKQLAHLITANEGARSVG